MLESLLTTLVLSSAWPRAYVICFGPGRMDTPWSEPETRPMIAEIGNCQNLLAPGSWGHFSFEMGGEPIAYEGPLYLDGSRDHRMISPGSGDVTTFRLDLRGRERLNVEVDFMTLDGQRLGGVERTSLRCQSLGG